MPIRRLWGIGIGVAIGIGILLWFLLLASASANTHVFARYYPHLVALNIMVVMTLLGLVGWQLRKLWQDSRAKVFGSQLKLRLMVMFGLVSVIPGVLVYAVSVQFITRSIDTWFDVRVETALESGLNLGRAALDSLEQDLNKKARVLVAELSEISSEEYRSHIFRFREQSGVQSVSLLGMAGQALVSDLGGVGLLSNNPPSPTQLKQVRQGRLLSMIEGEGADQLQIRVLALVASRLGGDAMVLQLLQPVPEVLAKNGEEVQAVYRDYQELQLAHSGLTQIYALTLTLTVLVALFGAFAVAFYLAKRLAAPLYMLTQGTQAVAQGDFSPRLVFSSQDELGGLTESFNQMTRQLDDARKENNRHREELESAHAYLESILANLSAGVLVFDKYFVLRTINAGALAILGKPFEHAISKFVEEWPEHQGLGRFVRDGFAHLDEEGGWEKQFEMKCTEGKNRTLLLRGSRLPQSGEGYVLVFDDVSELISAQRSAAWGEVARRLAHEIKNPLTPIQLSAERLQMRLAERLSEADAEMLGRSTQTIINQVQAMKNMVDDFRDYGKMPLPQLVAVDLNKLILEVLGLYESSPARFVLELTDQPALISGDPTQLRQIIHNLLRNAEDALEGRPDGTIEIRTETSSKQVKLVLRDNGTGFPAEILPKVFEPYVTTKPKGTGLGLPIVKKIVEEHQGKIEISNLSTGGAQISLRLPLLVLNAEGKM
ncbi:MAG: hypothetical protein RIR18_400 [Pseudomonadota bacterium]|jgi:nitrogen fixation/metabolism regulation signal transduction histidine kinase